MRRIFVLILTVITLCDSSRLFAEATGAIYQKDSARTVFADEVETLPPPKLEFFPSYEDKQRDSEERAKIQPQDLDLEDKPSDEKPKLKIGESVKPDHEITEEQIVEKFGDPNKPFPVTGVKDAPVPFQGMLTALNAGKPELAKQYARQFLHYINEVKATTARAQELYREVLQEDGLVDKTGRIVYENEKQAVEEENFDEADARKQVRLAVGNTLPADPFGKLDVYLFFKLDETSASMMPEAEKLYESVKDDPNVRFKALLMENVDQDKLKTFISSHQISFPIKLGASMSEKLKLTVAPTTVLVTATSKKSVIEEGYRRFFYLDELMKLMRGKSA